MLFQHLLTKVSNAICFRVYRKLITDQLMQKAYIYNFIAFVRFPNSIVFDWQNFGVSSIKFDYEPNRSQLNDWSSIGFNYQLFDWLCQVNTKEDTR